MYLSNYKIPVKGKGEIEIPTEILYKKGDKVPCRDPFIMLYGDKYLLYRSMGNQGIGCLVSDDLENWSAPVMVYRTPENFHGVKDFYWAPECHYYKGNFYIFTSVFSSRTNHRNISVYRADNPFGPFVDIANGCVGKPEWDTIDGTLYVDEDGQPWMAFVHEWTSMDDGIGSMAVVKLTPDLARFDSEPIEIFKAKDVPWARNRITDGPYVYKTAQGKLMMIWSNHSENGYAVAKLYSSNGKIDGRWIHEDLLYDKGIQSDCIYDGGHAMLFFDKEEKLRLALHTPNDRKIDVEHLSIKEVIEKDGTIVLK